jgi:serine/threonine protein kinase/Tol biopolymer transport system component
MTLERDTLLHKRYRIIECLGQGGMGSIYRAVDENLGVDVAVKENLFTTDEYSRQFRLEAVILANLRHPNLPRVSDHFVIEDQGQYLIMDFIEGEDLRQRMERLGLLSEDDAIQIGAAICDALSYLHARKPPILHRDIKPGNVKISPDGHIFLVDFGLAKVVQAGNQATTTGARAMTPGYSPPEQYGTARTDPRTDIYSLGATLYASLSGSIPEDGLARAMDNAELTPLRKRNPKISKRLAAVIEKAMAIDPGDRYQNAEEFKRALLSSKSKTQQLTGTYTVAPPPNGRNISETKSEPVRLQPPAASTDEQPFVSPQKKRQQKDSRRRRQLIWILLGIILLGFLGINFVSPNAGAYFRPASLAFASPSATTTTLPLTEITPLTPYPSPTSLGAEATVTPNVFVPADATATATFIPTPIGAEKLQLAFASTRSGVSQIYISDLLGLSVAQVTNMPEGACQPSWAPDGTKFVFISPCKLKADTYPNSSLYIINADGTQLKHLPTVPGGDFEPAWSPDGKRIAFTSLRSGNMRLYVYDIESEKVTPLTDNLELSSAARQAAWSPDGKKIAYSFRRFGDAYQLWLMTDTGRNAAPLLRSGDDFSDYLPAWSPDGKLVLLTQRGLKGFSFPALMILNTDTPTQPRRLGVGVLSIEDVDYSPEGFYLAFEGSASGVSDIYYMTVTGANLTQLTTARKDDFDPAWRPGQ